MNLNLQSTACVSIDMLRGHLDPAVATLPLPAERCGPLILRAAGLFRGLRAAVNPSSCILCTGFDATNRDFRVIIAEEAVDSMDGEEAHRFALRILAATAGWVMSNEAILNALQP